MDIIKVPTSYGGLEKTGSEKAPDAILAALKGIWLSEDFKEPQFKVSEIDFCGETNIPKIHNIIFKNLKGKTGIVLGGDHSITYSSFKAFVKDHPDAGIISFDAHPDVYPNFDYAVLEDWLFHLVEENLVKPQNVILIGIRASSKKEIDYLNKKKITYYTMKNIFNNLEKISQEVIAKAKKFKSLYLTLDIDAVDPAFAPGTGYIEPGGLSSRELLFMLQQIKNLKNLKSLDIVEINPDKDINGMTAKLGAKIVGEFL
ncbi:MAG: arginase family protein [Nanoarchaeota archaeon]|nr:arginase family protein [Nanoarchaeota archaeon]